MINSYQLKIEPFASEPRTTFGERKTFSALSRTTSRFFYANFIRVDRCACAVRVDIETSWSKAFLANSCAVDDDVKDSLQHVCLRFFKVKSSRLFFHFSLDSKRM